MVRDGRGPRRRRLAKAVWIPLRQSETVDKQGDYKPVGSREDVICIGSVAIAKSYRRYLGVDGHY